MTNRIARFLAAAALAGSVATPAAAHRQWLLPSATSLSGEDVWVTVDAAVSNDLFYFEHQPLRLDSMKAWAPDGTEVEIKNPSTGRYRSTFDVQLTDQGTYRIGAMREVVSGSYTLDGKRERLPRGTSKDNLTQVLPTGATDVALSESVNRNEIFVTLGAPTTEVFSATGKGIELVPVTHPNDLYAGESAMFSFVLDGQPATGLDVEVVPGGIRYRNQLNDMKLKTAADGTVEITWPEPGMYWINVTTPRPEGGPAPARNASYVTVVEVLAP